MRPNVIARPIFLALLMFTVAPVMAADPKPEAIPPFCAVSPQCSPDNGKSSNPAAKNESRIPQKSEVQACNMGSGRPGGCYYYEASLQWLCCSKSPYASLEKGK
ncbi:hypothetical protein BWI17_19130 [Betaproteobacteria bacterium GR16-43]|nr:hypothetical protein BWI17_19130 [Betaproteobacteria bacterium GR16-43]